MPDWPPTLTATILGPAPGGVTHVMVVALTTVTDVAGLPANVTVAPAAKLVPAMLTSVPPAVLPCAGAMPATVGAGVGVGVLLRSL